MVTQKLKVQVMAFNNLLRLGLLFCFTLGQLYCPTLVDAAEKTAFKISSDSSKHDFANQIIIYKGNAIFTTDSTSVSGEEIRAYNSAQELKNIRVTGQVAKLSQYQQNLKQLTQLSANTINYQLENNLIKASNNITITQRTASNTNWKTSKNDNSSENHFTAQGQTLELQSSPLNILTMSGNPLQLTISQPNQATLTIEANEMTYNQLSQQFELVGDVTVSTGRDNIKTAKVFYNGKTRVLQLPETQGQRVEMTQTKKGSYE